MKYKIFWYNLHLHKLNCQTVCVLSVINWRVNQSLLDYLLKSFVYSIGSNNYTSRHSRPRSEKRRDSNASLTNQYAEKRQLQLSTQSGGVTTVAPPALNETRHIASASAQNSVTPTVGSGPTASLSYGLGHSLGAGTAIAAAASQAIAATQQVQNQL